MVCSHRHRRSPVAVGDGGVSLPPLHHPHPHSLSVPASLFVCFPSCFLFKASKDSRHPPARLPRPPPHLPFPLPLAPKSPRAVRMICKLQTTESPSLVSAAHLGNSISRREGRGGGLGAMLTLLLLLTPPTLPPEPPSLLQLKAICNKCLSAAEGASGTGSVKAHTTKRTTATHNIHPQKQTHAGTQGSHLRSF